MCFPVNPDRESAGVNPVESFADLYAKDHGVEVGIIPCADRCATEEETYNLTLKNIVGRGLCSIYVIGKIKNFVLQNAEAQNGAKMLRRDEPAV